MGVSTDLQRLVVVDFSASVCNQAVGGPVYVVCRRGVLSSRATLVMLEQGFKNVRNVEGGLSEWHRSVDPSFIMY
jgi:rhodanese-related sulfurtransferase